MELFFWTGSVIKMGCKTYMAIWTQTHGIVYTLHSEDPFTFPTFSYIQPYSKFVPSSIHNTP